MTHRLAFIIFSVFLLHCGQSQAQYVILEEDEQEVSNQAEPQATEKDPSAISPQTTDTEVSTTSDAPKQTSSEEGDTENTTDKQSNQDSSATEEDKPLYAEGTPVRKTIAQRRAERRIAKKSRVFR